MCAKSMIALRALLPTVRTNILQRRTPGRLQQLPIARAQQAQPTMNKRPSAFKAVTHLIFKTHTSKPIVRYEWKTWGDVQRGLLQQAKSGCHIAQRTVRILGTALLRAVVPHPLGWPLEQELICMMMYGILQGREVHVWRGFFDGTGDLQSWVPAVKQQVQTGSCSSWWIRLPPEARPTAPKKKLNWVFFHGGAFVAGNALMYIGPFIYWLHRLARAGIDVSILSVEYPLAPEHPFPAAIEAAAGAIQWLREQSGETADYIVGGDSAGGNLTVAALAMLRDQGRLSRLPLALTLISPAMDMSDTSVFARRETVSSHIDSSAAPAAAGGTVSVSSSRTSCDARRSPAGANEQLEQSHKSSNAAEHSSSNDSSKSSVPTSSIPGVSYKPLRENSTKYIKQHLQQQHSGGQPQASQQQQQHSRPNLTHSVGGTATPLQLLQGLVSEVQQAWKVHRSKAGAAAAAAQGWFDYLPGPTIADDMHNYLQDPGLLADPLVSPTYLGNFTGLCQYGMLVVAGGAELMRPDIESFARKVAASGVRVQYHEEPNEPHCYACLAMPHLLKKGAVVTEFVDKVANGQFVGSGQLQNGLGAAALDKPLQAKM